MTKIALSDALERVRTRRFGSRCATPSREQWDLISLDPYSLPLPLQSKRERALLVRAVMEGQLRQSERWLQTHGFNFPVQIVRSLGETDGGSYGRAEIEAVFFDASALDAALDKHFGAQVEARISMSAVTDVIHDYLAKAEMPTQDAALLEVGKIAGDRKFDRAAARDEYKRQALKRGRTTQRGRPRSS